MKFFKSTTRINIPENNKVQRYLTRVSIVKIPTELLV